MKFWTGLPKPVNWYERVAAAVQSGQPALLPDREMTSVDKLEDIQNRSKEGREEINALAMRLADEVEISKRLGMFAGAQSDFGLETQAILEELGSALKKSGEQESILLEQVDRSNRQVSELQRELSEAKAAHDHERIILQNDLRVRDQQLNDPQQELAESKSVQGRVAMAEKLRAELDVALLRVKQLEEALNTRDREIAKNEILVTEIMRSTSWRFTEPLRAIGTRFPGFARQSHRAARVVYWTGTGQLGRRLKESLNYRLGRGRAAGPSLAGYMASDRPWLDRYLLARYTEETRVVVSDCFRFLDLLKGRVISATDVEGDEQVAKEVRAISLLSQAKPIHPIPDASIVVPVHNCLPYTLTCLRTLFELRTDRTFEVIIADDVSTDGTAYAMRRIGGRVRLFDQVSNQGFLRNCNSAAEVATGRVVIFLNNDTLVLPGWLDELIEVLEKSDRHGLACSKLLNADGTLQEAGGIFWNDGTAWNYGRNRNPSDPEFNFVKECDYGSGASIAIPTRVWRELGGFDPVFSPAYCEDSDLAFRLRDRGYKVLYTPFSEVIHHEGVSHGRDESVGLKAYQVINSNKLRERWHTTLVRDHFPSGTNVSVAADRSRQKPHILFVDHYVPEPDRDAGSRTMDGLLKFFHDAGFKVVFWPDNQHFEPNYAPRYQRMGVEVVYSVDHPLDFKAWLADRREEFDYIFLSRPNIAVRYFDAIRELTKSKVLFYGHDVHVLRMRAERGISAAAPVDKEVDSIERLELAAWRSSDVIYYPSAEECDYVRSQGFLKLIRVLPPYVFSADPAAPLFDPAARQASPERTVVFVGGFRHKPNVDAIVWFCSAIWPKVRASVSGVRLIIVGSSAPEEVTLLAAPDIKVAGYVTDTELQAIYRGSDVAVAPLRYGAGVKGKVLEALFAGLPVVTTRYGAQGIPGIEAVCPIRDDAQEFADAVVAVLQRTADLQAVSQAGRELVFRNFSVEALREAFAADIPELRGARFPDS